jgi:hypothetical protein
LDRIVKLTSYNVDRVNYDGDSWNLNNWITELKHYIYIKFHLSDCSFNVAQCTGTISNELKFNSYVWNYKIYYISQVIAIWPSLQMKVRVVLGLLSPSHTSCVFRRYERLFGHCNILLLQFFAMHWCIAVLWSSCSWWGRVVLFCMYRIYCHV